MTDDRHMMDTQTGEMEVQKNLLQEVRKHKGGPACGSFTERKEGASGGRLASLPQLRWSTLPVGSDVPKNCPQPPATRGWTLGTHKPPPTLPHGV